MHWEFQCSYASFENILEIPLTPAKQMCSIPKHLAGASSDLVKSMVKVGRKAAELERVKLQTEIQKGKSEIRRKRLENKLKMSKEGGKGGQENSETETGTGTNGR